jgi:glycosyltransferase involved in cell wall biosynthesis
MVQAGDRRCHDGAVASLAAVVIPVHDGARFLADALGSVAEQDLDLEVVVVDDGSTDSSAAIAQDLGVTCIRQPHLGPAAARNAGIEASTAPFIVFLDADDLIPPGAVARQLAYLEAHPGTDGVMGMQEYRVLNGVALPDWAVADKIGQPDEVSRPSVFASVIRRSTFDRVGIFDPRFRLSEDVDWLLRAKDLGAVIDVVSDVVLVRRIHGANLTYDTPGLRRSMFEALGERARRKRSAP